MLSLSLSSPACEVDVSITPPSGNLFSYPLSAPALWSGQPGQPPCSLPPAPLPCRPEANCAHHLGPLCLKLSAAPAWPGWPSSPQPSAQLPEPSGPLERMPSEVLGGSHRMACPLPGGFIAEETPATFFLSSSGPASYSLRALVGFVPILWEMP